MKVAVIGAGKMGVWFAKFFNSKNYEVILADRKKEKLKKLINLTVDLTTNFEEAVKDADQIFLCVSISAIEEVVKTISPALHQGQVVMDICSIKEAPVKTMHQYIKTATVLGTHPVFGPGSTGLNTKHMSSLQPTQLKKSLPRNSKSGWKLRKHTSLSCHQKNTMN